MDKLEFISYKFRIIFFILLVSVLDSNAESVRIGDLFYELNSSDRTAKVSRRPDGTTPPSIVNLEIPNSVDFNGSSYAVTEIAGEAFTGYSSLESVVIPNSVITVIGSAFSGATALKTVVFGTGVSTIKGDPFGRIIPKAFWLGNTPPKGIEETRAYINYVANNSYTFSTSALNGYYPITKVYQFLSSKFTVDGVTYIPISMSDRTCDVADCVYDPQYSTVTITDNVSYHGIEMRLGNVNPYSFYGNSYIQNLDLSMNGDIGEYSFYKNANLISANIHNKGYIGKYAFSSCAHLNTVRVSNQGDIKYQAFYQCANLGTVEISNAGDIGNSAFSFCGGSFSAKISNSGSIAAHAFYKSDISYAEISNKGSIGSQAFEECPVLSEVKISNQGNICSRAFYTCPALEKASINCAGEIGEFAFREDSKLKEVLLGENVTGIAAEAFCCCVALKEINLPNSVTGPIGRKAFLRCDSLTTIVIGNQVSGFEYGAFEYCSNLKAITIPQKVNFIGNYAFYGCTSLADVTFEQGDQTSEPIVLGSNDNNPIFSDCPLDKVYIGRKLSYNTDVYYGYSPFYGNSTLRVVEISDSETTIYPNEFYGCSNLQIITMGDGITEIKDRAFSGCASLNYFLIGTNVNTIGEEAFSDCVSMARFYSLSAQPPVCGNQALDDINKWDCTLYVPSQSIDLYQTSSQWKDFLFIKDASNIEVASIALNTSELILKVGQSYKLTTIVSPTNATNPSLSWTSSDHTVAEVSTDGTVTALNVGVASITASATDGSNVTATCTLTVSPTDATGVTILAPESTHFKVGESMQLTATIDPETTTDKTLIWSSSNPTVVTVDATGMVEAIAVGSATITVKTTNGLTDSVDLTVDKTAVSNITLSRSELRLEVGESCILTATVNPANATDPSLIWASSNPSVATVTSEGHVTALSVGSAIIIATANDGSGVSATCMLTVDKTLVTSITLSETELSLEAGQTAQLTATVTPSTATDQTLTWSSSDPTVATVSATGLVTVIAEGTCTITATTTDGSNLSASCQINALSGITEINADGTDDVIYDLQGRRVNHTQPGRIYIVNGQKRLM